MVTQLWLFQHSTRLTIDHSIHSFLLYPILVCLSSLCVQVIREVQEALVNCNGSGVGIMGEGAGGAEGGGGGEGAGGAQLR